MPKYSIIIPVYNCITYLDECVQSVLHQTKQDYELLLIDDGSTDGSGALCDKLAEQHTVIRVFHKKNGGAASARNVGIDHAQGEYILFVDCDDTIADHALYSLANAMQENSMAIYGMAFEYYAEDGQLEKTELLSCKHDGKYKVKDIVDSFSSFFEDNALSSACNKCFCGDLIREHKLRFCEGMTLYEDLEFVLRYIAYTESVLCMDQVLYHYRLSITEQHLKNRVADADQLRKNLSKLINTILDFHSKEAASVAANLYMQMLMRNILINNYSAGALRSVAKAYCEDENFNRALACDAILNKNEKNLLKMVENERFVQIIWMIRVKRLKSKGKQIIKRCLCR